MKKRPLSIYSAIVVFGFVLFGLFQNMGTVTLDAKKIYSDLGFNLKYITQAELDYWNNNITKNGYSASFTTALRTTQVASLQLGQNSVNYMNRMGDAGLSADAKNTINSFQIRCSTPQQTCSQTLSPTIQEAIVQLSIVLFGRGPTANEFSSAIKFLGVNDALARIDYAQYKSLSLYYGTHPEFTSAYASLTDDKLFVYQLFMNASFTNGPDSAVLYWSNLVAGYITKGMKPYEARAIVAGDFAKAFLLYDSTNQGELSLEEYRAANSRQLAFYGRMSVALGIASNPAPQPATSPTPVATPGPMPPQPATSPTPVATPGPMPPQPAMPPPTISYSKNNTGPLSGGTQLALRGGSGLQPGLTITVGGANCPVKSQNLSEVDCITPPRSVAGSVDVVIRNPDGQKATLVGGFTYINSTSTAPKFSYIKPNYGSMKGGTMLGIRGGSGFKTGMRITVGGIPCAVTRLSATEADCTTGPISKSGYFDVTIYNTDGQSATLKSAFKYTSP